MSISILYLCNIICDFLVSVYRKLHITIEAGAGGLRYIPTFGDATRDVIYSNVVCSTQQGRDDRLKQIAMYLGNR